MASSATVHSGAQALMFSYSIRLGNALQAARMSQLRIQAEQHFDEIRLFLDPGGLVPGIAEGAGRLTTNLGLTTSDLASGAVRAIPPITWHAEPPLSGAAGGWWGGVTLVLPAGTELGISAGPTPQPALRLRFPNDTEIEVGGRDTTVRARHAMHGMAPVLLDGIPLLDLSQPRHASLELNWTEDMRTAVVNILGIVSPYRHRGQDALYHIMEAIGDRVVGGSSIQVRA